MRRFLHAVEPRRVPAASTWHGQCLTSRGRPPFNLMLASVRIFGRQPFRINDCRPAEASNPGSNCFLAPNRLLKKAAPIDGFGPDPRVTLCGAGFGPIAPWTGKVC